MRGLSLRKTALLSFALHLTVFAIAFVILRQSNHILPPATYTVDLVSPDVFRGGDRRAVTSTGPESGQIRESREPTSPAEVTEMPKRSKRKAAKERDLIEKRIADLRRNERVKKRIEAIREKSNEIKKLAGLRKIISLKARGGKRSPGTGKATSARADNDGASGAYYAKITREIWEHWIYPDVGRKDIEAIVSVKILKDGTAIVQKLEKSSGNALFDRSARRAVEKASPLSPPPYEMEIGVRFYP